MLDLNYVRKNLDQVRSKLQSRGMPGAELGDFAQADAERRRLIAESDQLNAQRNAAQHCLANVSLPTVHNPLPTILFIAPI